MNLRKYFTGLVLALIGYIYFQYFSRQYLFDGILYASVAARELPDYQKYLFHPNHFIFNVIAMLFCRIIDVLRLPVENSYQALQIMNAVFGVLGLALFFIWLRKSTEHYWLSLGATIFLGFSALYWTYSVDAQVYVVNAFFVILAYYVAFKYSENTDWSNLIYLAIASSLAILAHQSNVLLILPCLWLIRNRKKALAYLGVVLFLVGVPYLAVVIFQQQAGSVKQGLNWMVGVASSYGPGEYRNPYWSFRISNVLLTLRSVFSVFWNVPDSMLKLTSVLLLGLVTANLPAWKEKKEYYQFALVTVGSYLLFFSVWNPGNSNYLLGIGILLVYMFTVIGSYYSKKSKHGLYLAIWSLTLIITFTFNFETITANTELKNNRDYGVAAAIAEKVKPQDIIITSGVAGYQAGKVYLPYFFNLQCLPLDLVFIRHGKEKGLEFLRQTLKRGLERGQKVYILSEVLGDPRTDELLKKYWQITPQEVYNVFQPYRRKKVILLGHGPESLVLFRITN